MELIDSYWIDENENRWSRELYTIEQAEELSSGLEGCFYCTNCSNCYFCADCVDCHDCKWVYGGIGLKGVKNEPKE